MVNNGVGKIAVTTLALSLLISAGMAFTPSHAHAKSELTQIHKDEQQKNNVKAQRIIPLFEEAAKIIGMSTEDLIKEVQQGKSIVEVAKAKGVSEKKLTSKMMSERVKKLNETVKSGKIKKEQAAKIKEKMGEHLKMMLNKKGLPESKYTKHHHMVNQEQIASMLGMTRDELIQQLKAGRSLSEIAQEKGISREQLIQQIKDFMTPMIEKKIDKKYKKEE